MPTSTHVRVRSNAVPVVLAGPVVLAVPAVLAVLAVPEALEALAVLEALADQADDLLRIDEHRRWRSSAGLLFASVMATKTLEPSGRGWPRLLNLSERAVALRDRGGLPPEAATLRAPNEACRASRSTPASGASR